MILLCALVRSSHLAEIRDNWESIPREVRHALRDLRDSITGGMTELFRSTIRAGVTYKAVLSPIDESQLAIVNAWRPGVFIEVFAVRIDGVPLGITVSVDTDGMETTVGTPTFPFRRSIFLDVMRRTLATGEEIAPPYGAPILDYSYAGWSAPRWDLM